jgi:hypothetical protein
LSETFTARQLTALGGDVNSASNTPRAIGNTAGPGAGKMERTRRADPGPGSTTAQTQRPSEPHGRIFLKGQLNESLWIVQRDQLAKRNLDRNVDRSDARRFDDFAGLLFSFWLSFQQARFGRRQAALP